MRIFGLINHFVLRITKKQISGSPESNFNNLPKAQVLEVLDGDTVIVSVSTVHIRVRLAAIDCPEDGQPWGETAKAGLIKMIGGREVYLEGYGLDAYGRTVATIYLKRESDLINVNERMVMLGHAWVMRRYYCQLPRLRQLQLNRLERWARSKKVGLWKTENPLPPWLWRSKRSA